MSDRDRPFESVVGSKADHHHEIWNRLRIESGQISGRVDMGKNHQSQKRKAGKAAPKQKANNAIAKGRTQAVDVVRLSLRHRPAF